MDSSNPPFTTLTPALEGCELAIISGALAHHQFFSAAGLSGGAGGDFRSAGGRAGGGYSRFAAVATDTAFALGHPRATGAVGPGPHPPYPQKFG